eukprot:CAMPEP_0181107320 /NCGR_PEP_ID=MMETSP1071-20121207/17025_1 /TAXON_ID=35127 /ORGANISM="Thalassiosira sp., Strain NH16" /LENGTH=57 /DNA_ID=CAMNT_0023190831 /DNA_START=25 /DNA_END=198 /DNA_ORIENTATION=+
MPLSQTAPSSSSCSLVFNINDNSMILPNPMASANIPPAHCLGGFGGFDDAVPRSSLT